MELRAYLQILLKNWWIILPLTLGSLTASLLFSCQQPYVFETNATYITRLNGGLSTVDQTLYALDTLTARDRIFQTYCEIMTSDTIRQQAITLLDVNPAAVDFAPYSVQCSVLPNSNVIAVTTQGLSPVLLARFAEAIGLAGMQRVNNLYSDFPLEPLDHVTESDTPVSPNHTRNAVLGGVFGLLIGVTLAVLREYLRAPYESLEEISIRSPQIGAYNARYFEKRLSEEINRSRLRLRPMCVALLQLEPNEDFPLIPLDAQNGILRNAWLQMQQSLAEPFMIAYMGQHIFAILMSETPAADAYAIASQLYEMMRTNVFRFNSYVSTFEPRIGLIESSGGSLTEKEVLTRAMDALKRASLNAPLHIEMIRTTPSAFDTQDLLAPAWESNEGAGSPDVPQAEGG